MTATEALLARDFGTIDEMVAHHALIAPDSTAFVFDPAPGEAERKLTYAELDRLIGRVSSALQRDGVAAGEVIALCGELTPDFVTLMLGAFRAGVVVAPLATWLDPAAFAAVMRDSAPRLLFVDASGAVRRPIADDGPRVIALGQAEGGRFEDWLPDEPSAPRAVQVEKSTIDIVLYSSGTTSVPKGVAQRRASQWNVRGFFDLARGVTMVTTPLYSAVTLAALIPTLVTGGCAVLMARFDALRFLTLAERYRATHAVLVPAQYRRILQEPDFDRFDLGAFVAKISSSAPLSKATKAEIVRRWPGAFYEYYSMSEGSCVFRLDAWAHPDKLDTVGRAVFGCEARIIDPDGRELPRGEIGEIVGRSPLMMAGYHGQGDATGAVEWFDAAGTRFLRTGDLGSLDSDGFLTLAGRVRDIIISGGMNIYAQDLERALERHPQVEEAAVVAAPSERWGETPIAFVTPKFGARPDPALLRDWTNARVGKMQRLASVELIDALPKSPIGKVLKRELRSRLPSAAYP